MKKIFVLIIALAVIGMSVVPSVQAQDMRRLEQLQQEMSQLVNAYSAKTITFAEYQRRYSELDEEFTILATEQANANAATRGKADTTTLDGRRLEQLFDQRETLRASLNDGGITLAQFNERFRPIDNEIKALIDRDLSEANRRISLQADENNRKLWPGTQPGWPKADGTDSIRELCRLGPFTQTTGTRASYSISRTGMNGPINLFTIYQTGNTDRTFREMKNQIERITGKTTERLSNGAYRVVVNSCNIDVLINNDNVVVFRIAKLHD